MAHTFNVAAGETLTIDTRDRTVYLQDPANSRYQYVDFLRSSWWPLEPGDNYISFAPDTEDGALLLVTWHDAWL